jgi:hypothetical protein
VHADPILPVEFIIFMIAMYSALTYRNSMEM